MKRNLFYSFVAALLCLPMVACDKNEAPEPAPEPEPELPKYEAVDMGVSVKWAAYNIGAEKPEEYGGYYAWGETEEKETYSYDNYKLQGQKVGNIEGTEYDVAKKSWGGEWRMPTCEELQELINNCTWIRTELNGVGGYKVTAKNGNSIFFPASGYKWNSDKPSYEGDNGSYWTGTQKDEDNAYYLTMGSKYRFDYSMRFAGQPVRAVHP